MSDKKYIDLGPRNKQEEIIYAEVRLVFDFQELLCEAMEEREISKDDLTELLDISSEEVTQLFNDANPTLREVARIFYLVGSPIYLRHHTRNR